MTNEYQELGTVIDTYETKMTTGNGGENETWTYLRSIGQEHSDTFVSSSHHYDVHWRYSILSSETSKVVIWGQYSDFWQAHK